MATKYVTPTGAGSKTGADWSNAYGESDFTGAYGSIHSGDTVLFGNGTYAGGWNLTNSDWENGITLQANSERLAHIIRASAGKCANLSGLDNWTMQGFYLKGGDYATGSSLSNLCLTGCDNFTFKRGIISHNNRYYNSELFELSACAGVLIEESEFYHFQRHAIGFNGQSDNGVVRRCYFNDRGYDDIGGGSTDKANGDSIVFYPGSNNIVENCIFEGWQPSVASIGYNVSTSNAMYGCVHLQTSGDHMKSCQQDDCRGNDITLMSQHFYSENCVIINPAFGGYVARSPHVRSFKNCSVFCSGTPTINGLFYADEDGTDLGDEQFGVSYTNCLAVTNGSIYGFYIDTSTPTWTYTYSYCNAYGASNNYDPDPAGGDNCLESAPTNMSGIYLYIPATSNMHAAGLSGADIGANIIKRYTNGVLGTDHLWVREDRGAGLVWCFPMGARITGLNDDASGSTLDAQSAYNVHLRLGTIPAGSISGSNTCISGIL